MPTIIITGDHGGIEFECAKQLAAGRRLNLLLAGRSMERMDPAVARKLAVAVWHVLMGHVIGALEPIGRLQAKLFKLATGIGVPTIKALGHASKAAFIEKKLYQLKNYP